LLVFYFEARIQSNENQNEVMISPMLPIRLVLFCVAMLSAICSAVQADPSANDLEAAQSSIAQLTPHDVGSRYGQALGAVQICRNTRTTVKVPALSTVYTGADLKSFEAQAKKIYDAWIKLKQCTLIDDPSECNVVVDESCAAAIGEIGPSGTVFPGLMEGTAR
jgi:hypothetical protein